LRDEKAVAILAVVMLTLAAHGTSRAETAIGAVFGHPGNVGLSLRFDRTPIGVAWSDDFVHATIDRWMIKKPLEGGEGRLSWYFGPGADFGIPLDDAEEFFFAVRAPIGLQFMATPKIETFGELAPGLQVVDETDFYWAAAVGIRFVLGG